MQTGETTTDSHKHASRSRLIRNPDVVEEGGDVLAVNEGSPPLPGCDWELADVVADCSFFFFFFYILLKNMKSGRAER